MPYKFELDYGPDESIDLIESNTIFPDQIREMGIIDECDKEWASDLKNKRVMYGLNEETAKFIDRFSNSLALHRYLEDNGHSLPEDIAGTVYEFLNKRPFKYKKDKIDNREVRRMRDDTESCLSSGENMMNA